MEYIKFGCSDTGLESCEFCSVSGWSGLPISRCLHPYPHHSKLPSYQCKAYSATPTAINEQARLVDDYQPRNLSKSKRKTHPVERKSTLPELFCPVAQLRGREDGSDQETFRILRIITNTSH